MPSKWPTTSSAERGYGTAWCKLRLVVLKQARYLCQCDECARLGRIRPAQEVDHRISKVKALSLGWTTLQIDDLSNLQAINKDCHAVKSIREKGHSPRPAIGADGYPLTASNL